MGLFLLACVSCINAMCPVVYALIIFSWGLKETTPEIALQSAVETFGSYQLLGKPNICRNG